jgi:hypothetical protein
MIFWQIIPVLNSQKKTEINSKKRVLGSMSRSKLCENGPEKVEKTNTLLHIVYPGRNAQKKLKKVRSVRGYFMPVY